MLASTLGFGIAPNRRGHRVGVTLSRGDMGRGSSAPRRDHSSSRGRLIGRHQELLQTIGEVRRGVSTVIVSGPAGVGKSRLAQEALHRLGADHQYWTETVFATRESTKIPFSAVAQLLPDEPITDRYQLFQRSLAHLKAQADGRAVALLLDDVPLLDSASIALIHHLCTRAEVQVIATARTGMELSDALAGLHRRLGGTWLELAPLSAVDTSALAAELLARLASRPTQPAADADGGSGAEPRAVGERVPADAAEPSTNHAAFGGPGLDAHSASRLFHQTEGNPLFVRELVLGDPQGWSIDRQGVWVWEPTKAPTAHLIDVAEGRVARTDPEVRALVEVLAIGGVVAIDALRRMRVPLGAIDRAERLGLVVSRTHVGQICASLSHPLFGEAATAHLSALHRGEICRRLIRAGAGTPGQDDIQLALWHLESGEFLTPAALHIAALKALGALDAPLAITLSQAALQAGGGVECSVVLAEALMVSGQREQAERAETLLAELQQQVSQPAVVLDVIRLRVWNLAFGMSETSRALAVLDHAAHQFSPTWPQLSASIASQRANLAMYAAQTGESLAILDRAGIGLDHDQDTEDTVLAAVVRCGSNGLMGRTLLGSQWGREAVRRQVAVRQGRWSVADHESEIVLAYVLAYSGDVSERQALMEANLARSLERGWAVGIAVWCTFAGTFEAEQGRLTSALDRYADALSTLDRQHSQAEWARRMAWTGKVRAHAQRGEVAAARSALAEHDALPCPGYDMLKLLAGSVHGWVAAAEGDLPRATRLALGEAESARRAGLFVSELLVLHDVVRWGGARRVLPRIRQLGATIDGNLSRLVLAHTEASAQRDPEQLMAVSRLLGAAGLSLIGAEAATEAVLGFREADREIDAEAAVDWRTSLLADCQSPATPTLQRLGTEGVLTPRERQISRLAADGRSSREIADQLSLSVRTVDNQLQRAYRKLGVSGRRELHAHHERHNALGGPS